MNEKELLITIIQESLNAAKAATEALAALVLDPHNEVQQSPKCQHKNNKHIGTMTAPDSWFCFDCNTQFTIKPSTMVSIEQKED